MARSTNGLQNGSPISFAYTDTAAREAATGDTLATIDIGKLALQLDDGSLWMLQDNDPITWGAVGGGGGGGAAPNWAVLYPQMFTRTVSGGPDFYINPAGDQPYGLLINPDGTGDGNEMEIDFPLAPGTYNVMYHGKKNPGFAILDWFLDTVAIEEGQDWYADPEEGNVRMTTDSVVVSGTSHTLKMVINGKNGDATDYVWGLSAITFKLA